MATNLDSFPHDRRSRSPTRPTYDSYNNPYYLHSSDHAGLQLVTDRLTTGADFHSWRRSIQMALNVRNKLGFVTGKVPKPPDDHIDSGSWSRCNDMVATWLMNSVSKKIGQSLLFISTAEGIWKNLLSRFKQDDAPRVFEIEQRISTIQQGSMDVSSYYTELITLWEEYKNYVELPLCTCGKCECGIGALWENLQERSKVTKFLMGLNEGYEQTRRHILMLKPLPTMENAFNIVAQDERQKAIKPAIHPEPAVFYAHGHNAVPSPYVQAPAPFQGSGGVEFVAAYNNYRNKRPVCTHCGLLGHTVNKCYQIYGYPPGYRIPPTSGQNTRPQTGVSNTTNHASRPQYQNQNLQQSSRLANQKQTHSKDATVAQISADVVHYQPFQHPQSSDLQLISPSESHSATEGYHLVNHVQTQVGSQNPSASSSASVTNQGFMAPLSTAGPFSGLDDW